MNIQNVAEKYIADMASAWEPHSTENEKFLVTENIRNFARYIEKPIDIARDRSYIASMQAGWNYACTDHDYPIDEVLFRSNAHGFHANIERILRDIREARREIREEAKASVASVLRVGQRVISAATGHHGTVTRIIEDGTAFVWFDSGEGPVAIGNDLLSAAQVSGELCGHKNGPFTCRLPHGHSAEHSTGDGSRWWGKS